MTTRSDLAKFRRCLKNSHLMTIPGECYGRCKAAEPSSDNNNA